jgi:hypothetical protein
MTDRGFLTWTYLNTHVIYLLSTRIQETAVVARLIQISRRVGPMMHQPELIQIF